MTPKELFEQFGGGTVLIPSYGSKRHMICGYYKDGSEWAVLDCGQVSLRHYLDSTQHTMLPDLPDDWRGNSYRMKELDLSSIEPPRGRNRRVCCRCGNIITSKKQHRVECGKKL